MRAVVVLSLLALLGCAAEESTAPPNAEDIRAARQIPQEVGDDVSLVVQGNNAFALDLYAELRSRPGNLFLSPYSISSALAMTWAGARGTTEEEMRRALHLPLDQQRLHAACGALQRSLNTGTTFAGYQLSIANRLWGQIDHAWIPSFLDVTREHYAAGFEELDIDSNPEAARALINRWVAEQTAMRIEELLPPGSLNPPIALVLTNAIYFKGDWATKFDPANTLDGEFHLSPTRTVSVPLMSLKDKFGFHQGPEARVLELPYQGRDLAMVFLLPEGDLATFEQGLTTDRLAGWLAELRVQEVAVLLPRFAFRTEFELKTPLTSLGMASAFSAGAADFSGMLDPLQHEPWIDEVYHEAFIRVDEEGSEAAAATGVVMSERSGGAHFRADHPFLFLILDKVTGQVLFLGRVADPSA